MEKLKKLGLFVGTSILALTMAGCYSTYSPRRTAHNPYIQPTPRRVYPGYSGRSHKVVRNKYGQVIRRERAVWGTVPSRPRCRPYSVGLPRNATPQNIRRKFQQDVEYMRRMRAMQNRGRRR